MAENTTYPHIEHRADGKLWLIGTETQVIEVVLDRLALVGMQMKYQRQHPTLTLGQIHSSLAYYYDHLADMERVSRSWACNMAWVPGEHREDCVSCSSSPRVGCWWLVPFRCPPRRRFMSRR